MVLVNLRCEMFNHRYKGMSDAASPGYAPLYQAVAEAIARHGQRQASPTPRSEQVIRASAIAIH